MDAATFDISQLLAPHDLPAFFAQHWETEPLVLNRRKPGYYTPLFTAADLDRVIAFTRPQFMGPSNFAGGPPAAKTYVQGCLPDRQPVAPVHYPGIAELRQSFAAGKTVVIRSMQHRWLAIASLCRNLEAVFHCPVHTNLYLTPPHSQGFEPHIDTHEVFALQIDGTKHWRLYDMVAELPLAEDKTALRRKELGPPREVILEPGDLLYIPRGYAHEAFTTTGPSLHLTVGVNVYRWLDLLQEALTDVARRDARFRASVPPGLLLGGAVTAGERSASPTGPGAVPAGVAEKFHELLQVLGKTARVGDAARRLGDQFFGGLEVLPDGYFAAAGSPEEVGPETVLTKRPGVICRLLSDGETAVIEFPGGHFGGPARIAPALAFMARADRFLVRELPGMGDDAKLVLARRAVREGLFATAPPSVDSPGPRPTGPAGR